MGPAPPAGGVEEVATSGVEELAASGVEEVAAIQIPIIMTRSQIIRSPRGMVEVMATGGVEEVATARGMMIMVMATVNGGVEEVTTTVKGNTPERAVVIVATATASGGVEEMEVEASLARVVEIVATATATTTATLDGWVVIATATVDGGVEDMTIVNGGLEEAAESQGRASLARAVASQGNFSVGNSGDEGIHNGNGMSSRSALPCAKRSGCIRRLINVFG